MKIIWLGHGSFRLETGDQVILVDPWLEDNPMLSPAQQKTAVAGATHILVTHGHDDHIGDVPTVSKDNNAPVSGMYELVQYLAEKGAVAGHAFNFGGTITLGDAVTVSLVPALHSSSDNGAGHGRYLGREAGLIIKAEGRTLYISGDTGITADMAWIGDFYQPQIGILSAGGYFTMGMAEAAYAARTYFKFETVIPCHYRTFDLLEQSAKALVSGLPGVTVVEPDVMTAIEV